MSKKNFTEVAKGSLTQASALSSSEDHGLRRDVVIGTRRLEQARLVPVHVIDLDPNQPRDAVDEESQDFKDFVASIAKDGLIQAITVEFLPGSGRYLLIAGERRLRAVRKLSWTEVPCFIKEQVKASDRYALQLVENIQRENLNPVQKARGLTNLKNLLAQDAGGEIPWRVVEERVRISEERRKNLLTLLKLPDYIQKTVVATGHRAATKGEITEKHARALWKLDKYPEKQLELFQRIRKGNESISGDWAMEIAKVMAKSSSRKEACEHKRFIIEYTTLEDLADKLERELRRIQAALPTGGA